MLLLSDTSSSRNGQPADQSETPREDKESADSDNDDLAIDVPERSRPDEAIGVQITGAEPRESVEFTATIRDPEGGEWQSTTTFLADRDGVVDLAKQAPRSGTYEGIAPMGWLWSMRAGDEEQPVTTLMTPEPTTVILRASAGGRTAERRIVREIGEGVSRTAVDREELVGTVYEPAGDGPHPGVLVLHGSGGSPVDLSAALLASHGFAAFALQYLGDNEALPDRIVRVPLSYFDRAAAWFLSRSAVGGDQLGIVGHSRGAEAGLLLGERYDWVGAVVSYAGSPVAWDTPMGAPAWLDDDGAAIPAVTGQGKPTLTEGQLDAADGRIRRRATVALDRIDGSVLLISGEEDPIWPAARTAADAVDRLDDAGSECEHRRYEDAGHCITPPVLPKNSPTFGGTPAGMAHADADSWPVVLASLAESLDPAPTSDLPVDSPGDW